METNVCDVNRLDSDVLLPPRKRLLACLKKQNVDGNGSLNTPSACNALKELDSRISCLLKAQLSNNYNPSEEEIVAASRAAAEVAVKTAMAARATAQEKAIIAAKAMAAAKKALEVVATFDDDKDISCSAEQELNNKMKKQVEVQTLYNNKKPRLENGKPTDEKLGRKLGQDISSSIEQDLKNKMEKQIDIQMLYNDKQPRLENGKPNDEELARKLHQAINSSPRISKCGAPSNIKTPKPKKLKSSENGRISNGSIVARGITRSSNDKEVVNTKKSNMENGSKPKSGDDDITTIGRKRGRMKQKKLPLSICHDRDQATLKEDGTSKSPLSVGASASSVVERSSLWKCQAFKAPVCVKQNKVMQS